MKEFNLFTKNAAIAASFTLLSASVGAAVNSPAEVKVQPQDMRTLLKERFEISRQEVAKERYIIEFKEDAADVSSIQAGTLQKSSDGKGRGKFNAAAAKAFVDKMGAKTKKVLPEQRMVAATMTKGVLNKLRNNPNVADISLDAKRRPLAQTTPYGYNMVQANQLAQNNTSARKVCVIDTGYNLGHPDLPDQNSGVTGEGNSSAVGNWYNDGHGHGTHVAGTITALDNTQGVIGVYPGVNMHIVKIFDDNGNWTYSSDLIAAINQCKNAGANVVNMSLGGGSSSTAERNAMDGFESDGILLVAAAGNDGNSSMSYPASYDAVMSVAAVGSNESRASYSQYNSQVEIAAPGSSVYSTYPTNTYATLNGTSMATPHVAGASALVWSFFPQCSNTQIRAALNATAKDKGSAGRDIYYGHGIVQVADAYDYLNAYGCSGDGSGGGSGGGGVEPVSGQLTGLSATTGNWKRYTWDIPAGVSTLTVSISGGSGDADLYMRFGAQPTTSSWDCRPYKYGNNETCTFTNPSSGTWHIGLRAYASFSGVTMDYSYE